MPLTRGAKEKHLRLKLEEEVPFEPPLSSTVFERSFKTPRSPEKETVSVETDTAPPIKEGDKEESPKSRKDSEESPESKKDSEELDKSVASSPSLSNNLPTLNPTVVLTPPSASNNSVSQQQVITQITKNMADTTLTEAFTLNQKPAQPQFISPPIFNPCSGNIHSFLSAYERTAIANSWNNALKISYLGSFLEGAANIWFTLYKEKPANKDKTWTQVKVDLTNEFDEGDLHRTLEMRLLNRKQRSGESIKSYFYDLKTLYFEFDQTMNVEGFRKYFENGISPELYTPYRLIRSSHMTMDKFKDIVLSLQDIMDNKSAMSLFTPLAESSQPQQKEGVILYSNTDNYVDYKEKQNYQPKNNKHKIKSKNQNPSFYYPQGYPSFPEIPPTFYPQPFNFPPYTPNYQPPFQNSYGQQPKNNFNSQVYSNKPQVIKNNPQFNYQNTRNFNNQMPSSTFVPTTRTRDGRPVCHICKKPGHSATACFFRSKNAPNGQGQSR